MNHRFRCLSVALCWAAGAVLLMAACGGDSGDSSSAPSCPGGCSTPPGALCSGDDRVTFSLVGECQEAGCYYTPSAETCEHGCTDGQCDGPPAVDPCEGVVCDDPPDAGCDGDDVVTYAAEGACDADTEGECEYTESRADCSDDGMICEMQGGSPTCVEPPAACDDEIANGDESDVDCGGSCPPCAAGAACGTTGDCAAELECHDERCLAPTCRDGRVNGAETGMDCGGPDCDPCSADEVCRRALDCESQNCDDGICLAASCADTILNGLETDVDCGGSACDLCPLNSGCLLPDDCETNACDNRGRCAEPTCTDRTHNGDETDRDCGGPTCPARCSAFAACLVASDCAANACVDGFCPRHSCFDGEENGDETGVDCGGDCEATCPDGAGCDSGDDCDSGVCSTTCQSPSCSDSVFNGDETDEDCGGSCAPCTAGQLCLVPADCDVLDCPEGGGACPERSCFDGEQNGDELAVDCAGDCEAGCPDGTPCRAAANCTSLVCLITCRTVSCEDFTQNGDETGIDCGGSCEPCGPGGTCEVADDCTVNDCVDGVCPSRSCFDGSRNGDETDVDCGGDECPGCGPDARCDGNDDCEEEICEIPVGGTFRVCIDRTCEDGVQNGPELGVDCGFAAGCPGCPAGAPCLGGEDCASLICLAAGLCLESSCRDTVQNGTETAPDCGGDDCAPCPLDLGCIEDTDCASRNCGDDNRCTANCDDTELNGLETDVDCGGPDCEPCPDEASCNEGGDCLSYNCVGFECVAASCDDGVWNGDEGFVDCGGGCGLDCEIPCAAATGELTPERLLSFPDGYPPLAIDLAPFAVAGDRWRFPEGVGAVASLDTGGGSFDSSGLDCEHDPGFVEDGAEAYLRFVPPESGEYTVTTDVADATFTTDTILYALESICDPSLVTPLACNDNAYDDGRTVSTIVVTLTAGQIYWIIVDSSVAEPAEHFALEVTGPAE